MANSERNKQRDSTEQRKVAGRIVADLEESDRTGHVHIEEKALETFLSKFVNKAKFSNQIEHKHFLSILHFLIRKKLLDPSARLAPLSVFQCLRILLRDPEYQRVFIQEHGMNGLKTHMDIYLNYHAVDLSDSNNESTYKTSKVLSDMLNILHKLIMHTPSPNEREEFISSRIVESISRLLNNSQDLPLLQDTLRLLINMIVQSELYVQEIVKTETIDSLLQTLSYEDLETKQLALQLMASFLDHSQGRECVMQMPADFLHAFTGHLSHNNVKVLDHTIWCLIYCAGDEDNRRMIRLNGAIPLLLSLLENQNFDFSLPATNANQRQAGTISKRYVREETEVASHRDQLFDMQSACCTCLAELSFDYTNGQAIIERNGIYTLAMLLFPEIEDLQRLDKFIYLQRNVFRTLRYLFSLNKNRDQFKRLFTISTFELFLQIGNFQRDLNAYKLLTDAWNMLSMDELSDIKQRRLQSLDPKREPTRFIRDYGVYDCLGSGAFGSVYRVAKRGTTTMCALKEIDNRSLRTDGDRSLGKMINEVTIIREELRHPNIVSYYRIFSENDKLYIVMELIEGSSLQDYLTLVKESNRKMTEMNIWRVLVQLILALRYLHKEKGIVHRDLTANNIMLDDEYRVKITDFGLAKLRDNDCSKMTSVVGTMYYACPEIIQHLPYNEKADIWSLGCVLYHMATLVPPFYTSNLLSLASKICASEYDQTPLKHYSDRVRHVIVECLCIDPARRPDIYCVAQLCTEQLMLYTDRSGATIQKLEKRLRQQDHKRELDLIKQQVQLQQQQQQLQNNLINNNNNNNQHHHQRCLSCSSTKESLVSNSGGMADVSFDGTEGQQEISKQDGFSGVSDCETPDSVHKENVTSASSIPQTPVFLLKSNNLRRQQPIRVPNDQPSTPNECPNLFSQHSRSPESSNVSFESGYDSNNLAQPVHRSSSFSNLDRKPSPIARSRPNSAGGPIIVNQRRLRPTDPVTQLLEVVHKIVYISQTPSNPTMNSAYRRLIERYKRSLFSKRSLQNLKSELSKLSTHLSDCIEFDSNGAGQAMGLQSLANSSRSSSNNSLNPRAVDLTIPESDGCVTYEQMMSYIEQVLQETGYYKESSSESLPPAVHRLPRPPSGKK